MIKATEKALLVVVMLAGCASTVDDMVRRVLCTKK